MIKVMNSIETLSRSEMKNIAGGLSAYPEWCDGIAEQIEQWHGECTALATSMGSWASADCHEDLAKTKLLAESTCKLSLF